MSAPVYALSVEADPASHRLTLTFSFDTPAFLVWAAMTEPSSVSRWLAPVSSDPGSDQRHLLAFEHQGRTHTKTFAVTACEPKTRLAGTLHDPGFPDSFLEARIDGTQLVFTHSAVPESLFEGYRDGWAYYLGLLCVLLEEELDGGRL